MLRCMVELSARRLLGLEVYDRVTPMVWLLAGNLAGKLAGGGREKNEQPKSWN